MVVIYILFISICQFSKEFTVYGRLHITLLVLWPDFTKRVFSSQLSEQNLNTLFTKGVT